MEADLATTVLNLKDDTYGFLDFTANIQQIKDNIKYVLYGAIFFGVIASQDVMIYGMSKIGDSGADNLFFQILGFGAAIINGITVIGA